MAVRDYWAKMTPEQRRVEIKRRTLNVEEKDSKRWPWILLVCVMDLFGLTHILGSIREEAAEDKCMDTYGPLDWDVLESLSLTMSSAIKKIPCSEQHAMLDNVANIPKAEREEWLARMIQEHQRQAHAQ